MKSFLLLLFAAFSVTVTSAALAVINDSGQVRLQAGPKVFTLENGVVVAKIDRTTGRLTGLSYEGKNVLGVEPDRKSSSGGYWSLPGTRLKIGPCQQSRVILDPGSDGGDRATVSCRFNYAGKPGEAPVDVDFRYSLGRGDSALYVYAIWHHRAGYPKFILGVGRFAIKLNPDVYNYLTVDSRRHRLMPTAYDWRHGIRLNLKEARRLTTGIHAGEVEHKYDYSAVLFDTPAFGWSGTNSHVGLWMINPSFEYIAGGATKVELTGHLDLNGACQPTLLNVWKGPHYGGTSCVISKEEDWTKVIGPFLLYSNSGKSPEAMWKNALARASREAGKWPYDWVNTPAYPLAKARGEVHGRIILNDRAAPSETMSHLLVGLSAPDYSVRGWDGKSVRVGWQRDGKFYEYWARGGKDGSFDIRNVRPGQYTLHAIADGVLGEYVKTKVTVSADGKLDLGDLVWKPVRYGRQLWDIGIPNRSAEEFRHGNDYWHWGLYLLYPKEFPHGVHYVIGKSNYHKDWNYCQPPIISGHHVRSSTWTIEFSVPRQLKGRAILRLAIAGSRNPGGINVGVNGKPVGGTGPLPDTGVMHRDGIRGYWCERDVSFDAGRLVAGQNFITLTCPVHYWVQGVLYDYLRLEIAGKPE